jgi:outer membrane protein assembly factor BamE
MNLFLKKRPLLLVPALLLSLSGCAVVDWMTYKLPVQQGNIIEQKDVDKLKPGMTRDQVVFVLGEPLARSSFESGRWEYTLTTRTGQGETTSKRLAVMFNGDALASIAGDFTAPEGLAAN